MDIKEWYESLEKREQNILIVGAIVVVFYLVYGVFYSGIVDSRDKYLKRNSEDVKTLTWMQSAVQEIQSLKGSGANANTERRSLSRLSDSAARIARIKTSRFQPKGETEAQVWLDDVEFDQLVDYMGRLELEYGLLIEDLSISSTSDTGIVNARLKLSR